jgi:hypothetical protein
VVLAIYNCVERIGKKNYSEWKEKAKEEIAFDMTPKMLP